MVDIISRIDNLRSQIAYHESSLAALREELVAAELEARTVQDDIPSSTKRTWPFEAEEYTRYGRQMILPGFGLPGQLNIRASKVLIIGLGGLGCPSASYLAGAGIGILGLIDGDVIELSNLHRQILHSNGRVGMKKVDSAAVALSSLNSYPEYVKYPEHLDSNTALQIFPQYDLILDCTDTPQTRYLISDAAVLCGKPLISASALRTDGQITILNHPPTVSSEERSTSTAAGPCYRCVFPRPPPPESVTSCGEGGVLGPVVGTMGILMALEAIKMISSGTVSLQQIGYTAVYPAQEERINHSMAMLSASGPGPSTFRTIRLKGKRADCPACGTNPTITRECLTSGSLDYAVFCGSTNPIQILPDSARITAKELAMALETASVSRKTFEDKEIGQTSTYQHRAAEPHRIQTPNPILIDVRDEAQFSICSLPGSVNIPWSDLQRCISNDDWPKPLLSIQASLQTKTTQDIYAICRLGNDSQLAIKKLRELGINSTGLMKDVTGGFKAWKRDADPDWPEY